jgi:hypothetical protein
MVICDVCDVGGRDEHVLFVIREHVCVCNAVVYKNGFISWPIVELHNEELHDVYSSPNNIRWVDNINMGPEEIGWEGWVGG